MKRVAAALLCLVVSQAWATSVVPMSVERLTEAAQVVVRAQAMESWSEWNPEHTMIHTYTRFRVLRAMKGDAGATAVVKQMGGRAGGYTQRVAGVRGWGKGEEAVLFLRRSRAGDAYVVAGLMQGDFRVRRNAQGEVTVSNSVRGVESVERASGQATAFKGERMTLKQLESRIEKAVQR